MSSCKKAHNVVGFCQKCQSPCCVIVIQLAAIAPFRPTSGKCTVVTGFLNWPGILQIPESFPASVEKRVKSRRSWKNAAAEPSLTPIPAARTDSPNQHEWRRLIIRGIKWMGVISPCGCANLKVLHRLVALCSEITCTRAGALFFAYGIRPHLCLMDGITFSRRTGRVLRPFWSPRGQGLGQPWHLHSNENNHGKYVNLPGCGWLRQTVLFQKGQMLLWVITYGNWIHLTITIMAEYLTYACDVVYTLRSIREIHIWLFSPPIGC